jgi:hypothetical protein
VLVGDEIQPKMIEHAKQLLEKVRKDNLQKGKIYENISFANISKKAKAFIKKHFC